MEKDGVELVRRSSGGGTVYHDLGNTNFTFLSPLNDYNKNRNTAIVCRALETFGIRGGSTGRNDIVVDGLKVSGSAYRISGLKAFHHGTLLLHADLDALRGYLNVNKPTLKSKGVESIRMPVVNLRTYNDALNHDTVSEAIIEEFFNTYDEVGDVEDLDHEKLKQEPLLNETFQKLQDWKWRFGETPQFEHTLAQEFEWGKLEIGLHCEDGKIVRSRVDCTNPDAQRLLVTSLSQNLTGATYDEAGVSSALETTTNDLVTEKDSALDLITDIKRWLRASL
eukprot:TRINITY_DN8295_c0_g1_i1.p1 TRINITY_DN8295_c0_g1~~TRINITY_DN8295_c0_g1_i1.p1  ORF type:complete len:280 (-),score=44.72 TRINITY_DN8295_c0_g1_i1:53-892(-)